MKTIPIYDDTKPISCTIGNDEIPARIELVERMRTNLEAIARSEHGMLLRFPDRPEIAADLERFTIDEKRCCEFWGFAIQRDAEHLVLRWDAPPDAADLITRLLTYFKGDEPIETIGGLLSERQRTGTAHRRPKATSGQEPKGRRPDLHRHHSCHPTSGIGVTTG